jgi:putative flippase GtrA
MSRLLAEAAKFLTVGGVATLVSFVIFNGLVHGYLGGPGPMHDDPLVAFVVANSVGMLVSYRGSRSWAFRNRAAVGIAGGRVMFFVINIVSMVIPLGCLSFSRYVLGLSDPVADNVSANVVGLGLGTLARFWALRRFIFLSPARLELRELARAPRSTSADESRGASLSGAKRSARSPDRG